MEEKIYNTVLKYFAIEELVDYRVAKRYGNRALRFFDIRTLETLIILRHHLNKPIIINNWKAGGKFSQRGLRTNVQQIVRDMTNTNKLYLSAHVLGKAFDFDVKGMTAEEVRQWIIKNKDLFPYKIRLEYGVNWVHLDTIYEPKNPKVYLFHP